MNEVLDLKSGRLWACLAFVSIGFAAVPVMAAERIVLCEEFTATW